MLDLSTGYAFRDILRQMLERVDDDLDKRQGSLIWTALAPGAWYLEGLILLLGRLQMQSSVLTATGESLDYLVKNRGITRNSATAAVRKGAFNSTVPSGSVFKTLNGEDSVLFDSGELLGQESGMYIYEMTSETPGEIGNSYVGRIVPVTAGLSYITTATIGEIIREGTAEETDTALRERFIETLTAAPYGGNIPEYRQAIMDIPGVGGVQVYPANLYNGGGTVLCSIISDEYTPASAALVATVQDAICPPDDGEHDPSSNGYGIAPVGAAVDIVSATALTVNVSCTLTFQSGVVNGAVDYKPQVVQAISDYITSVAQDWGKALTGNRISYPVIIYTARVISAILTVPEVINVSNLTLNGQSTDLTLTETAQRQEVPVLGEVVISE